MRIAYFDCFSGISGDMTIAALLDAGASLENLRSQLAKLPLTGYEISAEKVCKQGFAATAFHVHCHEKQPHRHLSDVTSAIQGGEFSERVTRQACDIFGRLAQAEACVHGIDIQKVHFHEVGAVDAIVDVVGACLAMEELDIEKVACSAIAVGSGTVKCAHGVLPVPAPATVELLKNVPLARCDEQGELTTPTGAAVVTTLADSFSFPGGFRIREVGYGAGQREGVTRPNLLRVLVGESCESVEADMVVVLQANIDDQTPELVAHVADRLMAEGALDAYCQPISMKKGRPGVLLTVLCAADQIDTLESLIFSESSTFGIRRQYMERSKLDRSTDTVELQQGSVRIKVGRRDGRVMTASAEFDDCRRIADTANLPVKEVMSRAMALWHKR